MPCAGKVLWQSFENYRGKNTILIEHPVDAPFIMDVSILDLSFFLPLKEIRQFNKGSWKEI